VLRNVFAKTLWDARRALVGWAIGLALMSVFYSSVYPSISKSAASLLQSYPETLKQAFQLYDLSPAGYLGASVFGVLGPLLMILFAVASGTRAIAGDEENGTLELLLAHPVTRTQVVLHRFAALVAAATVLGGAMLLALLGVNGPAELNLPVGHLVAMVVNLILLGVAFGAFALAAGAMVGRRAPVFAVTAVAGVLTYLANAFASQVEGLAWTRNLSPFHYYSGGAPLRHGLHLVDTGVLLAISAALVTIAVLAFKRRDVAV
jgi:ABC-2 type transport system permease protein